MCHISGTFCAMKSPTAEQLKTFGRKITILDFEVKHRAFCKPNLLKFLLGSGLNDFLSIETKFTLFEASFTVALRCLTPYCSSQTDSETYADFLHLTRYHRYVKIS